MYDYHKKTKRNPQPQCGWGEGKKSTKIGHFIKYVRIAMR